jgi:YHS domain-containing protein
MAHEVNRESRKLLDTIRSAVFADVQMAVDPICKMNVSESQAKYASVHNDKKYYFCSAACKQEFDKNPAKYA